MRRFLYIVTVLILLVIAALFVLRVYAEELTELALVPDVAFAEQQPLAANAYHDPAMWFSRPGMDRQTDPARWEPAGLPQAEQPPRFAVFFVHPTSFMERSAWNAPLNDAQSQDRARVMVRGMASAFGEASEIWVPRYRQATFGAFLTDAPEAGRALDAAYRDVAEAFDYFARSVPEDVPIVIAGHSQGGYHVVRLLLDRIKDSPLLDRVAVAYPVGVPISVQTDLPQLGLPSCAGPGQAGCVAGWASFAEPADTGQYLRVYNETLGLDGTPRTGTPILCFNPLTGSLNATASAEHNRGTLVPDEDLASGELVPDAVPARCDPATGVLLIGDPPDLGRYVLPGNNYHVYDIPLFWQNLRDDVVTRVQAWQAARQ